MRPQHDKLVSLSAIRRLARQIAERFEPEQVILFGSYASGAPHHDSDVDILVVMPTRNEIGQAIQIREATEHAFPLDLLVRTPEHLSRRLEEGDWFLREILSRGQVLYEKTDPRMGPQGRSRLGRGKRVGPAEAAHS